MALYGSTTVSETFGDGTTLNVFIIPVEEKENIMISIADEYNTLTIGVFFTNF